MPLARIMIEPLPLVRAALEDLGPRGRSHHGCDRSGWACGANRAGRTLLFSNTHGFGHLSKNLAAALTEDDKAALGNRTVRPEDRFDEAGSLEDG